MDTIYDESTYQIIFDHESFTLMFRGDIQQENHSISKTLLIDFFKNIDPCLITVDVTGVLHTNTAGIKFIIFVIAELLREYRIIFSYPSDTWATSLNMALQTNQNIYGSHCEKVMNDNEYLESLMNESETIN